MTLHDLGVVLLSGSLALLGGWHLGFRSGFRDAQDQAERWQKRNTR